MSTLSVPHTRIPRQSSEKIAAIYARVSTADQADKGYSLPTQIEACLDLAEREGYVVPPGVPLWREALCCLKEWEEKRKNEQHDGDKLKGIELWNTIVQHLREQHGAMTATNHVFVEDYTGMSLNRPQLAKLRELVRQGSVQAVFVHEPDRLSRKLAHQLLIGEEFEQAGVAQRVITMPDDTKTPESQLLANVRGIIAEYERAKIVERTTRGRKGRAQAGHVPYGRRTYGYRYVKHADKGAHYEIHLDEAEVVRRIFRLYIESEISSERIAALLTQEGIPTPTHTQRTFPAGVWHPATVSYMLRNETYAGTMYDGKKQRLPGKTNPDKKTRHRRVPKDEWTPIPVPPIIERAMFETAQVRRVEQRKKSSRNRKHEYLFINGRLRCDQCGRAMGGALNSKDCPGYRCYRPAFQDVVAPHIRRSVQASAVEPVVWDAVERALNNPALIAAEIDRRKDNASTQHADLDRERHEYTRQIAQCEKELSRWYAAYAKEVIDLDDFQKRKAEVDTRRASAEQELARLDAEYHALVQSELETASLIDYCARVRTKLQHFTLEEKRQVLQALNITVIWHPGKPLRIHGSIPVTVVTNASK
jgi:site-specific DNA recombinase